MTWVNDPEVTFYFARLGREITRDEEAEMVKTLMSRNRYFVFHLGMVRGPNWSFEYLLAGAKRPHGHHAMPSCLGSACWTTCRPSFSERAFGELGLHKFGSLCAQTTKRVAEFGHRLGFRKKATTG